MYAFMRYVFREIIYEKKDKELRMRERKDFNLFVEEIISGFRFVLFPHDLQREPSRIFLIEKKVN